jgi:hypothetical protein
MINQRVGAVDKMFMEINKNKMDGILITPNVTIELFDHFGMLKEVRDIHNTVTDPGIYGIMAQLLAVPGLSKAGWAELGEGTGGTTKLDDYVAGSRMAFGSLTRNNAVVTMVTTFAATVGTGALTEAGIFDVVTEDTPNMWMYTEFDVVNKLAADSLVLIWTLTLSTI